MSASVRSFGVIHARSNPKREYCMKIRIRSTREDTYYIKNKDQDEEEKMHDAQINRKGI